jgi:hypothetical protein
MSLGFYIKKKGDYIRLSDSEENFFVTLVSVMRDTKADIVFFPSNVDPTLYGFLNTGGDEEVWHITVPDYPSEDHEAWTPRKQGSFDNKYFGCKEKEIFTKTQSFDVFELYCTVNLYYH